MMDELYDCEKEAIKRKVGHSNGAACFSVFLFIRHPIFRKEHRFGHEPGDLIGFLDFYLFHTNIFSIRFGFFHIAGERIFYPEPYVSGMSGCSLPFWRCT